MRNMECVDCRTILNDAESAAPAVLIIVSLLRMLNAHEKKGNRHYCADFSCVQCRTDVDCADGLACFNTCVERARNVTCEAPNSYEVGKVILGDLAGGSYGGTCTTSTEDRPETVFELIADQLQKCVSASETRF